MDLKLIQKVVTEVTGLDLNKDTRKREYIYARVIYFKIARELTTHSLSDIGEHIGKDHSTVLFNLKNNFDIMEKYEKKFFNLYKAAKLICSEKLLGYQNIDEFLEVGTRIENYYLEENKKLNEELSNLKEQLDVMKNTYQNDEISDLIKRVPSKNMKHFLFRLENLTYIMERL